MEVISFWKCRQQIVELLTCLKSSVSEHLWTVNMTKGLEDCLNLQGRFLSYFYTNLTGNQLGKFCFCSTRNFETVCQHIDTRWQVFSLSKSECLTSPIQMQLPQIKKIFSIFFCITKIYIQFPILWKKRWTSEVISFWNYISVKRSV